MIRNGPDTPGGEGVQSRTNISTATQQNNITHNYFYIIVVVSECKKYSDTTDTRDAWHLSTVQGFKHERRVEKCHVS